MKLLALTHEPRAWAAEINRLPPPHFFASSQYQGECHSDKIGIKKTQKPPHSVCLSGDAASNTRNFVPPICMHQVDQYQIK